jgi:methyltransferase FkbM-like protein
MSRCAALSNSDGESSFAYVRKLPASSGLLRRERLDDHLPIGYIPALIKLDLEGAERLLIEGAIEILTTHRPIVIFEHGKGGAEYYGTTSAAIFQLLCDAAGLRLFDLDGNDRWNFVALMIDLVIKHTP